MSGSLDIPRKHDGTISGGQGQPRMETSFQVFENADEMLAAKQEEAANTIDRLGFGGARIAHVGSFEEVMRAHHVAMGSLVGPFSFPGRNIAFETERES